MNRSFSVFVAILVISVCAHSGPARAQEGMTAEHKSVGIGFHNLDAPLGVRWWLAFLRAPLGAPTLGALLWTFRVA